MARGKGGVSDATREVIHESVREALLACYAGGAAGAANYFRAVESILYNYKRLEMLALEFEAYMDTEYHTRSKSIVYGVHNAGGSYLTDTEAAEEAGKQKELAYHKTRAQFDEIDRVVRMFEPQREFIVIRMYYFGEDADGNPREDGKRYTWTEIAGELSERYMLRDEKSARRWRNRIVSDIAVCLFGKAAAAQGATYRSCDA
jgi:hypothetical protein